MTTKARVSKLGKRQALTVWLLLSTVAAIVGSQNWFEVEYEFGATTKQLLSTGTTALPILNLAIWGGFITLAGVLFSQRIVSSIIAALGSVASVATALSALPQLGNTPPEGLFAAVAKLSGLNGDHDLAPNGTSATDGWVSYSANQNFVAGFVVVVLVLALVQAATAALAVRWPKRIKADRYAAQTSTSKVSSGGGKNSSAASAKDDAISLWDSQR